MTEKPFEAAKGNSEAERFIFYRGLGTGTLPLTMQEDAGGFLTSSIPGIRHVFVLRIENGRGAFRYYPELAEGEPTNRVVPEMEDAMPLAEFSRTVGAELERRLCESGLTPAEARAMVNTWRSGYFETEGIRTLFVLPREWTEKTIPMTISPRPSELVRVMVGRLEFVTAARVAQVEGSLRDQQALDAPTRQRGRAGLRAQGRFLEPILRRIRSRTADDALQARCEELLSPGSTL